MQDSAYEQVVAQVKHLPLQDLAKLRDFSDAQLMQDQRSLVMPDDTREMARQAMRRDLSAEYAWLAVHREAYIGQWVALKQGELISAGYSANEVYAAALAAGKSDAFLKFIVAESQEQFSVL